MLRRVRTWTRGLLGVQRDPTYYLPWLTRPGLDCVVLLNNIESRFTTGREGRGLDATVTQFDAEGRVASEQRTTLTDSTDAREVRLAPAGAGYGFVTVDAPGSSPTSTWRSPTARRTPRRTAGRSSSSSIRRGRARSSRWPAALLAPLGHTVPSFARDQYVYHGADSRSHLLVLNLSNVVNRVRVVAERNGTRVGARLVRIPPRGARLVDVDSLAPAAGPLTVDQLRLTGNAWFNLYLVGAGTRNLEGALSLMHVK